MMLHPKLLLPLALGLGGAAVALSVTGCSRQGEGERCSLLNGNGDCRSEELVCRAASTLRDGSDGVDRCCPTEENDFTDPACAPKEGSAGSGGQGGQGGASADGGSAGAGATTNGSGGISGLGDACQYTSQCPLELVCGPTGVCQRECLEDRDCSSGMSCSEEFRCQSSEQ